MRKQNWETASRLTSHDELLIGTRMFKNNKNNYKDWVKLTYLVLDISEPIYLFSDSGDIYVDEEDNEFTEYYFDILANIAEMMIVLDDNPLPVLLTRLYTFSTPGKHVVYVKFKDNTKIANDTFDGCVNLINFTLPKTVTTIGNHAFCRTGINEVIIPRSITTIEEGAFSLSKIKLVLIGANVQVIEDDAFYGCDNLKTIIVSPTNLIFDSRNNCNAIMHTDTNTLLVGCKSTIIPNTCLIIGEEAFSGCLGLTEIMIPNSVITINNRAFYDTQLIKITIPDSVISIGEYAFGRCYYLTEAIIGSNVQILGFEIFERCESLEKITSLAVTAPTIADDGILFDEDIVGTLYLPANATGYENWINRSLENWEIIYESR